MQSCLTNKKKSVRKIAYIFIIGLCVLSCRNKQSEAPSQVVAENKEAKQMLQGIWLNEDSESIAFRAKGDTIVYADSTVMPVRFSIVGDTLVLQGANTMKYAIVKQLPHLFVFKNQNGETVRLVKSENPDDAYAFDLRKPQPLNQRQLIKRDTVAMWQGERFHCYTQVNPTTYKVVKTSYNSEGVGVESIYYDNIVHLSFFRGGQKLYSSNFYKTDFKELVPSDFLINSVLSDILFLRMDAEGAHFQAVLAIHDSPSSYLVGITLTYDGKRTMRITN